MLSEAKHLGTRPDGSDGRRYVVYVLTNRTGTTLYVGMTNNIERRIHEHRNKLIPGFAAKYNLTRYVDVAISREKEIKGWKRFKKLDLIKSLNPTWSDLAADW